MNFADIQAVIMDMDGVLWRGDQQLPGMNEIFAFLQDNEVPFALATNNSRRTPAMYIEKLASMGVHSVRPEQIVTSSTATADYLTARYARGTRLYVIGERGLREPLADAGFVIADEDVELVVTGIDFELTYDKLRRATLLIRAGATYYATNPDRTFPAPEGLCPGAGATIALLEATTDTRAVVIGKPQPGMFESALGHLGVPAENTLMIGDRLDTDILGGINAGMKTAMMLTGVVTRAEVEASEIQPDAVYETLPDLIGEWQAVRV